jgi:hypothetical protein
MNKREYVIKVDGAGVDNDAGFILVYDCGDHISLVASAEKNGDAEVFLNKAATAALGEASESSREYFTPTEPVLPC